MSDMLDILIEKPNMTSLNQADENNPTIIAKLIFSREGDNYHEKTRLYLFPDRVKINRQKWINAIYVCRNRDIGDEKVGGGAWNQSEHVFITGSRN